jgi:hypothetical protein
LRWKFFNAKPRSRQDFALTFFSVTASKRQAAFCELSLQLRTALCTSSRRSGFASKIFCAAIFIVRQFQRQTCLSWTFAKVFLNRQLYWFAISPKNHPLFSSDVKLELA